MQHHTHVRTQQWHARQEAQRKTTTRCTVPQSTDRLKNAHAVTLEMEETGASILGDLAKQVAHPPNISAFCPPSTPPPLTTSLLFLYRLRPSSLTHSLPLQLKLVSPAVATRLASSRLKGCWHTTLARCTPHSMMHRFHRTLRRSLATDPGLPVSTRTPSPPTNYLPTPTQPPNHMLHRPGRPNLPMHHTPQQLHNACPQGFTPHAHAASHRTPQQVHTAHPSSFTPHAPTASHRPPQQRHAARPSSVSQPAPAASRSPPQQRHAAPPTLFRSHISRVPAHLLSHAHELGELRRSDGVCCA